MREFALRITAPHFCAAVLVRKESVYRTAPILRYMVGWTPIRVKRYAKAKGWKVKTIL